VCTRPNTCFIWPTQVYNRNNTSIGSAIFAQLTAVLSGMPGHVLSQKIAPSLGTIWTPSNTWFLGPTRVQILNGISIGSAVFAHIVADSPYTLQWAAPSASKLPLSHEGIWILDPHLLRGFLGPPEFSTKTASRSDQPFLQGSLCSCIRPFSEHFVFK